MDSNQLTLLSPQPMLLGIIWDIYSLLAQFNVVMLIILMLLLLFAISFGLGVIANALAFNIWAGWIMLLLIPVMMSILLCSRIEIWERQSIVIVLQ